MRHAVKGRATENLDFSRKNDRPCLNEHVLVSLRRRAQQDREVADRIKPGTATLESGPSDTGGICSEESEALGHRAHRLASPTGAGRRGAKRSGLESEARSFFDRPQIVKGGRKNFAQEDEPKQADTKLRMGYRKG